MRRFFVIALFVVVGACSGGKGANSITTPSAGTSVVSFTVESGRTGAVLEPTAFSATQEKGIVTVKSAGYFTLKTQQSTIRLWPADDGYISASFTRALIYQNADPGTLCRLPDSVTTVSVQPDATIMNTEWARTRMDSVVNALAVHPRLTFTLGGAGFPVTITVAPSDDAFKGTSTAAAATYISCGSDGVITAARIAVRSMDLAHMWYLESYFQVAMTHELLHATGIRHDDPGGEQGIMSATTEAYFHVAPTERELLVMKMQYTRRPGTRLAAMTEDETVVSQKSAAREQLVCVR